MTPLRELLEAYRSAVKSDPHSINYSLKIDVLIQLKFNLEWRISQIGNDKLGDILLRRYITGETLESIAEAYDVDVRTVSRWQARALELLERDRSE